MGIGNWFRNFGISSKSEFIPIFSKQADFLIKESTLLVEMLQEIDEDVWRKNEREIKSCEVQGDAMLTEFFEQLSGKIIFSINKIDLQTVAMTMDEFLDAIKNASKALTIYQPKNLDRRLRELGHIIRGEAKVLQTLLPQLKEIKKNYRNIILQCDRIKELEHMADDVYEQFVGEIFNSEDDVKELVKYKNIAEVLESATDAGKNVADNVKILILQYFVEKNK